MLKPNSLTGAMLKNDSGLIGDAPIIVKSRNSVSSTDLTGKVMMLPSGRIVAVVESTGRGTWKCMYDSPPMKPSEIVRMTKKEVYSSKEIELKHEFLVKYGEEIEWNTLTIG